MYIVIVRHVSKALAVNPLVFAMKCFTVRLSFPSVNNENGKLFRLVGLAFAIIVIC